MRPVFIMSSERSGSNLVRKMLGAHPEIVDPPPPHMWMHLSSHLPFYGPLSEDANLDKLIEDAIEMTQVENSHLEWPHRFEPEDVRQRLRGRTLSSVIGALYEAFADREGGDVWVCKENNLFEHAFRIRATFPEARFIYLARDGRDVACSMKKVPTHDHHVYPIAHEWRDEQLTCLSVYQDLVQEDAVTLLRYEELIEEPEAELQRLSSFIEVDYHPRMLHFHEADRTQTEARKTDYWENLDKPVMSDNKAKFFDQMSTTEREVFEAVAGDVLELLGYPIHFEGTDKQLPLASRAWYRLSNQVADRFLSDDLEDEEGRVERSRMLDRIEKRRHSRPEPITSRIDYDD